VVMIVIFFLAAVLFTYDLVLKYLLEQLNRLVHLLFG